MNLKPSAAKNVWIVNHYAASILKDGRYERHAAFAKYLPEYGWKATIFSASTTHPSGEQRLRGLRMRRVVPDMNGCFVWVRTPSYRGSGVRRVIGMVAFAMMMLFPSTTRRIAAPDVVIGSTVHPLAAWAGWRLARRYRVPFIFEIRDVWPDTLVHMGRMGPDSAATRILRKLMVGLCERASLVLSPLPGVGRFLAEAGLEGKPFAWVSNGVEGELRPVPPEPSEPFTFMYLGSHGNANALEALLDAFDIFLRRNREARSNFRLIGDGPNKDALIAHAKSLTSCAEISFEDRVPKAKVLELAQQANCHVVNMRNLEVYKFGISLNKLFDYLLSGRPVIFASNAMNNPVKEARAGLTVTADDREGLADAMETMHAMSPAEREELGMNGRDHVLRHFTYAELTQKLAGALNVAVKDRGVE